MTETTVNRVAELYKKKSDLFRELSILLDENNIFRLGYDIKNSISIYGISDFRTLSQSFLAEIKKLTEDRIKNRIEEIDKELKDL